MGIYSRFILPRLTHLACGCRIVARQREKVVPAARGHVLEIGIGSGLNLPFYDPALVERVSGLEPSHEMRAMAERAAADSALAVELIPAGAEAIPLETGSADTIVTTYTLCTIPDYGSALREMARVLDPSGRLLFSEHGLAPDERVRRWQDRVDGIWSRLAGGCHLNRDIPALLVEHGFTVERLDTEYAPGWRPASYMYWGSAKAR